MTCIVIHVPRYNTGLRPHLPERQGSTESPGNNIRTNGVHPHYRTNRGRAGAGFPACLAGGRPEAVESLEEWRRPRASQGGGHAVSPVSMQHDVSGFDLGFPWTRAAHPALPHLRQAFFDARGSSPQQVTARPPGPAAAENTPLAASIPPENSPLAANYLIM